MIFFTKYRKYFQSEWLQYTLGNFYVQYTPVYPKARYLSLYIIQIPSLFPHTVGWRRDWDNKAQTPGQDYKRRRRKKRGTSPKLHGKPSCSWMAPDSLAVTGNEQTGQSKIPLTSIQDCDEEDEPPGAEEATLFLPLNYLNSWLSK